ncbi:hypothetical protein N9W89_09595 [Hellea sp.]|nr:hypothetical protein [Hellea sp.]
MSFFKRKTNKAKKSESPAKLDLEHEIAQMDGERHREQKLDESTSDLNTPDPTLSEENHSASEPLETEQSSDKFLTDSLKKFAAPSFTANLDKNTKNVDVTKKTAPPETTIDDILANARRNVEGLDTPKAAKTPSTMASDSQLNEGLPNIDADIELSGPARLDMGAMRLDVAKISADIQGGEELYRRALQRVEGLMGFVEKAEIDFSVLNRLEPENRRLKAKLRTANGEVEGFRAKVDILAADLEDHQERLTEKTKQYEEARGRLTKAAKSLQDYESVLKKARAETESSALEIERHKTALSVEGKENRVLREKVNELSAAFEARQAEYLEASKMVESLRADCVDFREQADTFRTEAQELRIALNTAKRQNNAMKGEMQTLHEDIKTFKTQYEFNVIHREDQVTDLETQMASLNKEAALKTQLADSARKELADLRKVRNEQDIERARLEKKITATQNEMKDIVSLSEKRSAEKLRTLKNTVRELQTEIIRRDEVTEFGHKEKAELQAKCASLERERDRLQSRMKMQSGQMESMMANNPSQDLEIQVKQLNEQLIVKNDIVQGAAQDVAQLREAHKAQQIENKRLEDLIHAQTFQLEAAQKALLESKKAEGKLDKKYKDVAAALSVNQSRRSVENASESPDISPKTSDEYDDLTVDDIEDRIMDFKFGVRKNIV